MPALVVLRSMQARTRNARKELLLRRAVIEPSDVALAALLHEVDVAARIWREDVGVVAFHASSARHLGDPPRGLHALRSMLQAKLTLRIDFTCNASSPLNLLRRHVLDIQRRGVEVLCNATSGLTSVFAYDQQQARRNTGGSN